MERSEGSDDELYPKAPLPAHERGWRHPSEMGDAAWRRAEPPLTMGRGLTAATGAVGGLLALAVLWTIVPTHAGRSAGVSALSTVGSIIARTTVPSQNLVDDTTTTATTTAPVTSVVVPTTTGTTTNTTTVHVDKPSAPTYQIEQASPRDPNAIAVAIVGGLVITTANAVTVGDTVRLMLPDGRTETAHVVLIDARDGLAVLSPDAATAALSFEVADGITPGEVLTFYGDHTSTAVVLADGSIDATWSRHGMREGTPVVNERGQLVALCTHGSDGMRLVTLANLEELEQALVAEAYVSHASTTTPVSTTPVSTTPVSTTPASTTPPSTTVSVTTAPVSSATP